MVGRFAIGHSRYLQIPSLLTLSEKEAHRNRLSLLYRSGVNLGRLYDKPGDARSVGWAYFEDGSIYMNASLHAKFMDFDKMQAEMRLLEPIVRQPPPDMEQVRSSNPRLNRFIILG